MVKINKRAELLTENLIFILLNLAFFAILIVFIFLKSGNVGLMEEAYAKKIALILDTAKPEMEIKIDMQSALDKKDSKYTGKIVDIKGNVVTVKLREKGGYSYSFFNDIELDKRFFDSIDASSGKEYSFNVLKKKEVI